MKGATRVGVRSKAEKVARKEGGGAVFTVWIKCVGTETK